MMTLHVSRRLITLTLAAGVISACAAAPGPSPSPASSPAPPRVPAVLSLSAVIGIGSAVNQATILARVTDATGAPVDAVIRFETTTGVLAPATVTAAGGLAQTLVRADAPITVRATSGDVEATLLVALQPGPNAPPPTTPPPSTPEPPSRGPTPLYVFVSVMTTWTGSVPPPLAPPSTPPPGTTPSPPTANMPINYPVVLRYSTIPPDAVLTSCEWSASDGKRASGCTPQQAQFTQMGPVTVTLSVRDTLGRSASNIVQFTIGPAVP